MLVETHDHLHLHGQNSMATQYYCAGQNSLSESTLKLKYGLQQPKTTLNFTSVSKEQEFEATVLTGLPKLD